MLPCNMSPAECERTVWLTFNIKVSLKIMLQVSFHRQPIEIIHQDAMAFLSIVMTFMSVSPLHSQHTMSMSSPV